MLLITILGNGDPPFRAFLLESGILQTLMHFCHASISSWLIVVRWDDEAINGALVARLLEYLLYDPLVKRESLRLLIISVAPRFPETIAFELMMYSSRFGNPLGWLEANGPLMYIETILELVRSSPVTARICLSSLHDVDFLCAFQALSAYHTEFNDNPDNHGLSSVFMLISSMCRSVDQEDFIETNASMLAAIVQIMNLAIGQCEGNWSFEVKTEMKLSAMSLADMLGEESFCDILSAELWRFCHTSEDEMPRDDTCLE
jgi:hypothetical protein